MGLRVIFRQHEVRGCKDWTGILRKNILIFSFGLFLVCVHWVSAISIHSASRGNLNKKGMMYYYWFLVPFYVFGC